MQRLPSTRVQHQQVAQHGSRGTGGLQHPRPCSVSRHQQALAQLSLLEPVMYSPWQQPQLPVVSPSFDASSDAGASTDAESTSGREQHLADHWTRQTLDRLYYTMEARRQRSSDTSTSTSATASSGSGLRHDSHQHTQRYHYQLDAAQMSVLMQEQRQRPSRQSQEKEKVPDYYANVGDAIRTLRDDIPNVFCKDLNYKIYRDDITFRDARNNFVGMDKYKIVFWALRFHANMFFSHLHLDVRRIWQPEDSVIKMRWTARGCARVPWEAEAIFDGISTYKLDHEGRIYEHIVNNVNIVDPPSVLATSRAQILAGLNLVPNGAQQPYPGA